MGDFTDQEPDSYPQMTVRQTVLRYLAAAAVVVGAGVWLPFVGATLAAQMGWNESFVGTIFVAVVTSVPEMVVTVAAVRLGALDMAVGNVLGSNLFNAVIIAVDDIFYTHGPLLSYVDASHVATAFTAIMMTGVAVVGFLYRPHRIHHIIGWSSIMMSAVFLFNTHIQYG